MKKWISVLLCLVLLMMLPLAASAAQNYVVDEGALLTPEEAAELDARCRQFYSDCGMEIAVVTVNGLEGKTAMAYADDYFDAHYGENGILLLIAMADREWHISTCGSAIQAFTDGDLKKMEEGFLYFLQNGHYATAFHQFLSVAEDLREVDEGMDTGTALAISLGGGAIISLIVLLIMRSGMTTKRPQRSAGNYEVAGSYNLRKCQDLFLYSRTTKQEKPQENKSTTHTSSSGRSHGGRGGKF